jgi:hypothetical protein
MEQSNHQKRWARVQSGCCSIRFEKSDEGDKGADVSRNDNRKYLRKEPLHQYLFGLLGSFYTSPSEIYYKYGKDVLGSTWDK